MQSVDCVVIGGGPAGGSAAWAAADAGLECLLLEARKFPGERTACGGGVTADVARELSLPDDVAEERLSSMGFHFIGDGSLEGPWNGIKRTNANQLPALTKGREEFGGVTHKIWDSWRHIGVTVDRRRLDTYLAQNAVDRGASLLNRARVVDVDPDESVVTYRAPDGESAVRAPFIIFCDGATTMASDIANIGFVSQPHNTIAAIAWEYEIADHGIEQFGCFYHPESVPWGYYWMFPRDDILNVGVGAVLKHIRKSGPGSNSLSGLLETFLEPFPEFENREPLRKLGGLVPLKPARNVDEGGMMVAGDAAGLVNPFTGGGIHHAIFSGRLAGEAVAEAWHNGKATTKYGSRLRRSPNYLWLRLLSALATRAYNREPGAGYVKYSRGLGTFAEFVDKLSRWLSFGDFSRYTPGWH